MSFLTIGNQQYCVHRFTSTTTFSVTGGQTLTTDLLIVGGGGGGGGGFPGNSPRGPGGGGGAGGVIFQEAHGVTGTGLPVTVGPGGAGGPWEARGSKGGNSTVFGFVAEGGGGGGAEDNRDGGAGGSGGGAGSPPGIGGSGTAGQGNSGGNSFDGGGTRTGGGGGGAASVGGTYTGASGNARGGNGVSFAAQFGTGFGVNGVVAGGGGGGKKGANIGSDPTIGGSGGGGRGASDDPAAAPTPGTAGTGGGGGGGRNTGVDGAAGGSGVVVLRYLVNTGPEADAGPDAITTPEQEFTLDGTGSTDPDGPSPTGNITGYQWIQTSGTSVTLTNANTAQPSFVPGEPAGGVGNEELTFQLTVTDALGLTATDTVTITLQAVPKLSVTKTVTVFSEDGSGCANLAATQPEEPETPAAIPGACIEFTITVQNTGSVAAEDITLVDALASHLTLQAAALDGNWGTGTMLTTANCPGAGCEVSVRTGVIAANETATITIRATIN